MFWTQILLINLLAAEFLYSKNASCKDTKYHIASVSAHYTVSRRMFSFRYIAIISKLYFVTESCTKNNTED